MPGLEFFAEADPGAARCGELAALQPANPFATFAYLQAERSFGGRPWLFGCSRDGMPIYGCLGFLRSGRLERRLEIASLPAAEEPFWSGLREFSHTHRVTILELNSFASPAVSIPAMTGERTRIQRHEFQAPLDTSDTGLLERLQMNHRQRVRKGMKAGLEVRTASDAECLADHVRIMAMSMQRRQARGESVPTGSTAESLAPYLSTGFCRLFQAVLSSETVSSMMVAQAASGAYLYTSGTSPAGMNIGASHFLVYEILKASRQSGAGVFNLGGVGDLSSGLAQYKRYFGAAPVALEAAEFDLGSALHKVVRASAGLARGLLGRRSRNGT